MIWRWVAVGLALALGVLAVLFWRDESARASDSVIPPRPATAPSEGIAAPPPAAPEASEQKREERRFNRYDKDRDEALTREESLASRRTSFAKLDVNGDGRLSFEECSIRTTAKFAKSDPDGSKVLMRDAFLETQAIGRAHILT